MCGYIRGELMKCKINKDAPVVLVKVETGDVFYPLSLLYLHNSLRKHGYVSCIVQLKSEDVQENIDGVLDSIVKMNPLYVGVSSMTGVQSHDAALFSISLKERINIPIVWGGIHPSLAPMDTIRQDYVDIVAVNEGERVVVDIANAIMNGDGYSGIRGIYYKDNSEIIKNRDQEFIDLNDYVLDEDDWGAIDFDNAIEIDKVNNTRTLGIQTSRGCPYRCGFCYNEKFTHLKMRYLNIDNLQKMVSLLREKYNVTDFMFVDDNIYFNKNRMFEVLKMIKSEGGSSTYLQMRVDDVTEESLGMLADLGVKRLFFGIESGDSSTKKLVNKKIDNKLILEKIGEISRYKDLAVTCAFIVGLPTETEYSIDNTIDLAIQITKIHPNTLITLQAYVPFPGTDLLEVTRLTGYVMPDNPLDFKEYDSFDGDIDITWAQYYDEAGKILSKKINIMNRYASMLTHSHTSTILRTLAKKILRVFAIYRLRNNEYRFRFEILLLHKFNRYYKDLYKNKQYLAKRLLGKI